MSERDELAVFLQDLLGGDPSDHDRVADALLAAGWRKASPAPNKQAARAEFAEGVARAMFENECWRYGREPIGDWAWAACDAWQLRCWRMAARAALAAMREPNCAQLDAAASAGARSPLIAFDHPGLTVSLPHRALALVYWRAMIDAALAEGAEAISPPDAAAKR